MKIMLKTILFIIIVIMNINITYSYNFYDNNANWTGNYHEIGRAHV